MEEPNSEWKRPPLTGGLPKLNRGTELMHSLMPQVNAWLHSDPVEFDHQRSDDFREYRLHAKFDDNKLPPVVQWALATGEILFNYRGALDHLVYTIAMLNTELPEPRDAGDLQFPIADTRKAFRKMHDWIGSLPDEAKAAIEALQPYNSLEHQYAPSEHPLSRLRDLNNYDKHRLVNYAVLNVASVNTLFAKADGQEFAEKDKPEVWVSQDPLQDGEPAVIIKFKEPTQIDLSTIDLKLRLKFYARSGSTPPKRSMPDELNDIREAVASIINDLNPPLTERPGTIPTAM
jgi:hypothetical protein